MMVFTIDFDCPHSALPCIFIQYQHVKSTSSPHIIMNMINEIFSLQAMCGCVTRHRCSALYSEFIIRLFYFMLGTSYMYFMYIYIIYVYNRIDRVLLVYVIWNRIEHRGGTIFFLVYGVAARRHATRDSILARGLFGRLVAGRIHLNDMYVYSKIVYE